MKGWGEAISNSKIEYDDWSGFSPEIMKYCVQDVMLNADVYFKLIEEYTKIYKKNPMIKEGLKVEHDTAIFQPLVLTVALKIAVSCSILSPSLMRGFFL